VMQKRAIFRLIPAWKLKRELLRIGNQAYEFLHRWTGISVSRAVTRRFVDPKVVFLTCELALGPRVAIYLIFPNGGLLPSHRIALDYIRKSGYVPVIVSNLPLSGADQAELRAECAWLIFRPNEGYDFGGYRDAIRCLAPHLMDIDHLAIFNDSSWFPLRPQLDWLKTAEAMRLDYVGSVSHEGLPSRKVQDFSKIPWQIDYDRKAFHYGSFSLLLSRKILSSTAFQKFWQDYIPTNNKHLTVRRGEIGLTRWVVDHGFTHGAVCESVGLDRELDALTTERLREIVVNLIDRAQPTLVVMRADALAADPPDRMALRNVILACVAFLGPSYALVEYDMRERSGNFVKKMPVRHNRADAEKTLWVLGHFDNPVGAAMLAEARAMFEATWGAPAP
jgi:hypothetical protein